MENMKLKILIIEDEEETLELIKTMINGHFRKARFFSASTGGRGLKFAAARRPDIILLDIALPGMDGFEVCSRLKNDGRTTHIPVIFITGAGSGEKMRIKALESGAAAFLAKPVNEAELLAAIKALARRKGSEMLKMREKKKLEKEVRLKTNQLGNYKMLVEDIQANIPCVMYRAEAEGDELRPVFLSGRVLDLTGYYAEEYLTEKKFFSELIHPEDREIFSAALNEGIKNGRSEFRSTYRQLHKSGKIIWVRNIGRILPEKKEKKVVLEGLFADITREKMAEESLLRSEAEYRELVENINDVFFIVDASGKIEYISPQVFPMAGYKPKEMTGKPFLDFIMPEDREGLGKSFREALENRPSPAEFRYLTKKGEIRWARSSGRTLVKEGRISGVNGILSDITEAKKAVEDIKRLTDLYLTLSQSNQAMVRVKSEEELFAQVTRVLSEFGHFDIAWVAAPDGKGGVKPLACAGSICDFLKELKISLDKNKPEGDFPTAQALRSGEDVVLNDWSRAGKDPWHMKVAAEGIRSVASFSLRKKKKVTAALSLYSRESGFFTPERVSLLKEMRWDVEYALEKIETEKEREKAEEIIILNENRLRAMVEILQKPAADEQEFLDHALDEALKLTGSSLGYIYFYDETERKFTLNSWSKGVMKECSVTDPRTVYELDKTGIWGEAVRQRRPIVVNDFESPHPLKKGYPEGHVKLKRFLTVPVFRNGEIVGVAGVANKNADYDATDELQLSLLISFVWKQLDAKKAEKEKGVLSACVEQSAEAVVITDSAGSIQYVNPAFEKITGYGKEETVGKNPRILKSGKQDAAFYREFWETISSGRILKCRMINRKKNGSLYTEEQTISPVRDASGAIKNYVSVKRDITENLALEQKLMQSQKMETVGMLAGGVAHDFNNLLTAIMSYSEIVSKELPAGDPKLADMREILSAAERGMSLTRQLLAFSRKQVISPRPADLNEIVGNMENILKRLIGENIKLEVGYCKKNCVVMADPGQIEQIILNLAVNSRDAMPSGGKVEIKIETVPSHVSFSSREAARVTVRDSGCGMSEETRKHVFEPFYTTKEQGKGTGLGLSTVFGIVKQNGGEIEFESEENKGTAFMIYFPRFEKAKGLPAEKKDDERKRRSGESVLFVEDEDSLRRLGKRILGAEGYSVYTAKDSEEALKLAESAGMVFDILVTDVMMPGISGRELSLELEKRKLVKKTLYMSGYTEDIINKHGVLEPGIDFLYKPFKAEILVSKIREILDKKR